MKRLLALVPLLVLLAMPDTAEAAPRRARADEGIHQGAYIYGAPAIIQIPIEDDRYADLDPTWGWGFGAGYLWTPGQYFKIGLGGAFEHTIYNWDDPDPDDNVRGNMLRLAAELRIGGGTNKVWGYGLVGPGLALSIVDVDVGPVHYDDTDAGFNLTVGGGVQGAVWRSLFLGGELDFDLNFFPNDEDGPYWNNDYEIHQLWIKFIIGWYF